MVFYFVGLHAKVMINRDSWGYSYSIVMIRGGILGFMEDELLPKHLATKDVFINQERKLGDQVFGFGGSS